MAQTIKYAKVLAKIGAKRAALLNETKLKALTESKDLTQLVSQLRDTGYQEKIAKIPLPYRSWQFGKVFQDNLIDDFFVIARNSPQAATSFLRTYIKRLEIENIKTLVKSVHAELDLNEKLSRVYLKVADFLKNRDIFEEGAKAGDLKQLVNAFRRTEYASALSLGLNQYEQSGSTIFFDILLDKAYYGKLYEAYQELPKKEKPHAFYYASTENDSFTILMLLRAKALNYDIHWLRIALPKNNFNLPPETVESMVIAANYESALNIAIKSYYGRFFIKASTPEETIANAQKTFRKDLLKHAINAKVTENFNVGAPLAFLTQKETETSNLTAITLGVEAAMKPEQIQRALILPN